MITKKILGMIQVQELPPQPIQILGYKKSKSLAIKVSFVVPAYKHTQQKLNFLVFPHFQLEGHPIGMVNGRERQVSTKFEM